MNGKNTLVSAVYKNSMRAKEPQYSDVLLSTGTSKEVWNAA